MHDLPGVHVTDGRAHTQKDVLDGRLVGQAVLVDEVEQAPVFGVFENYVGGFVLLVEAVVIHFYDVRVLQLHVDFYF